VIIWRISKHASLDGIGGTLAPGRWHSAALPILYGATHPSTCLLEIIVHMDIDPEDRPLNFQLLKIEAPDNVSIEQLPRNRFMTRQSSSQAFGNEWLRERRSLLLEVPSILVPEASNLLVNPLHAEAHLLRIVKIYKHPFDPRLL
jgi:RES domain-containing protein